LKSFQFFSQQSAKPDALQSTTAISNQESTIAIRNPQSAIRNPQSAIKNPQSAIKNQQFSLPPSIPVLLVRIEDDKPA